MNVLISGINGKMGNLIFEELQKESKYHITGFDISSVNKIKTITSLREIIPTDYNILVDFSKSDISYEIIKLFLENGIPVISGTTGIDKDKLIELSKLAKKKNVKYIHSVNFALKYKKYEIAAKQLKDGFEEISILESHDIKKLDAPSGTALSLAELLNVENEKIKSLRVHEITPSHMIIYSTEGERIILVHQILNRKAFVDGFMETFRKIIGE